MPDIPKTKPDMPLRPEKILTPEKIVEQGGQKPEQLVALERAAERGPAPAQQPSPSVFTPGTTPAPPISVPPLTIAQIERILSDDLEEAYMQMSPETQAVFKKKGEQTAREVKTLLEKAKVNAAKIAKLIMKWLKLIPGVNKFFLEQEAKIKTDEALKLRE